jgi:prolyl-tRNA editing enzyme YbaK/EbsC (Cys-tRNA(Pro) deacylase)
MCPFYDFFSKVIVDTALLDQQTVFCGSGDPQKTVIIDTDDMVEAILATVADVSKPKPITPLIKGA